jgi:hypothetical protein
LPKKPTPPGKSITLPGHPNIHIREMSFFDLPKLPAFRELLGEMGLDPDEISENARRRFEEKLAEEKVVTTESKGKLIIARFPSKRGKDKFEIAEVPNKCAKCGEVVENETMMEHWATSHELSDILDLPAFREPTPPPRKGGGGRRKIRG